MKKSIQQVVLFLSMLVTSVCAPVPNNEAKTGIAELDNIIETALYGSRDDLTALIDFTETICTHVEGLGGPPKCLSGESEGATVDVLPFLGPEGSFIRKTDIEGWEGLKLSKLYSVYQNSETVYSDQNYPAGEYAIVFIGSDDLGAVTLQIRSGKIIRIDYGIGIPPVILDSNVKKFLLKPPP
ncbi:MAG: hypothetical protein JNM55_12915 [Anaerolineales bacterium]|nr:hypothetical protein [Anaerolineales bacterium]